MKVLMIARATLFRGRGGDTTQVLQTASELNRLGVDGDIKLSNENIDYSEYDLIHFFNIIRPADILGHIFKANLPFVISTIYCDYDEYDKKARGGAIGFLRKFIRADGMEYVKAIARRLKNGERINSWKYLFMGHATSVKYLLKKANMLLPNSENEYHRLSAHYKVTNAYRVVVNGINTTSIYWQHALQADLKTIAKEGIVCVGQIEGRKNQINFIKAVNALAYPVTILGIAPANFTWYEEACKAIAKPHITFLQRISEEELVQLYLRSKVHVLASWFETTGLVSLEAAALGCNIVITNRGDTCDYFGNDAYYCEPADVNSIRRAVVQAYAAPVNESLQQRIITNYTWAKAAAQTLSAYNEVLANT